MMCEYMIVGVSIGINSAEEIVVWRLTTLFVLPSTSRSCRVRVLIVPLLLATLVVCCELRYYYTLTTKIL
jgi:hypothetical protein